MLSGLKSFVVVVVVLFDLGECLWGERCGEIVSAVRRKGGKRILQPPVLLSDFSLSFPPCCEKLSNALA